MEIIASPPLPPKSDSGKKNKGHVSRPSADYHPTIWGDYFITHPSLPSTSEESEARMKQKVAELVVKVKQMLLDTTDPLQEMELINSLQRLGVDYHFEEEINHALSKIHDSPNKAGNNNLHQTSLRFRLLRQHRYNVSSDVFEAFRDEQGNFKAITRNDLKGLLSLYEAGYLATPGERVLDDAISFARSRLEAMVSHLEPHLAKQVAHTLETPLRRRMRRLEARLYISIYEEEEENRNDLVLELAKCDFHMLQLLHREEIHDISMWWKKLGLTTKLNFARDRLVECYFWILGVYYEAHYSRARIMMTKVISMFSFMDDIYDVYGTVDELERYTDVIQRWDLKDALELDECLKLHFFALDNIIKSFEDILGNDGLSYRSHYLKIVIKEAARAWLLEAKWRGEGCVPTFDDHLNVSSITTCYSALACASYIGMGEVATKEAFEWVISFPKIIKAITLISRVMDDVVSHELETKRDHVASTIHCYMKENGTTIEESCKKLLDMVEEAWQVVNQEFLNLALLPMPLLARILNLTCMMETIYRKIDGYTNSGALKYYIDVLLVKPISF